MVFTGNYARLFWGLSDESSLSEGLAAGAFQLGRDSAFGLSWENRTLADQMQEQVLGAAYAQPWPWEMPWSPRLGIKWKWLRLDQSATTYTSMNSAVVRFNDSAWTTDVGMILHPSSDLTVGLALNNLLPTALGLLEERASLPLEIRISGAYRFSDLPLQVAMDHVFRGSLYALQAGGEYAVLDSALTVRAGMNFTKGPSGFGGRELTSGFSVLLSAADKRLVLDYGWSYPLSGLAGAWGTHRAAITYQFASPFFPAEATLPHRAAPSLEDWLHLPIVYTQIGRTLEEEYEQYSSLQPSVLRIFIARP